MFVVNFDFSQHTFLHKFAAINLPVLLTELITYPLQRIQTQLILAPPTHRPSQHIPLLFTQMFKEEGFPRCHHGLRFSLDYSITQMTFKFFVFDHLMLSEWAAKTKGWVYGACVMANALATVVSQSALNYLTIASAMQPSRHNSTESLRERLVSFTQQKSALKTGLRYTFPASIVNSLAEMGLIFQLQGKLLP